MQPEAQAAQGRSVEEGFTLIEVVISLALFALVSLAGLALVDSVLRVEQRTAGRLERLGQLQRAMFVLSRDLEQMAGGSLAETDAGIRFERQAPSLLQADRTMGYELQAGALYRLAGEGAVRQRLLADVADARWTFFFPGRGWAADIPVEEGGSVEQPAAIAVDLELPAGPLRRVIELPAPPR